MGARDDFRAATTAFCAIVDTVRSNEWERPGLGEWTVRDLVGHATRALTTIETYVGTTSGGPAMAAPADYFVAALAGVADRAAVDKGIAARGREAAAALGDDPAAAVTVLARRVDDLVARTPDAAPVGLAFGSMTLGAYLPTRTFELVVHTIDLADALGRDLPVGLDEAVRSACVLAGEIAARSGDAAGLLRFLTGRASAHGSVL